MDAVAGGARRRRTAASRRPHSQPDRLLSASCRDQGSGSPSSSQDNEGNGECKGLKSVDSGHKEIRTFKRRCGDANSKFKPAKPKAEESANNPEPPKKRRQQRLVLEGSDDEDSSWKTKGQEAVSSPKPGATEGTRRSSRIVKRRTFDDEEVEDVRSRRRKVQGTVREAAQSKQGEACGVEDNTDSADDEHPRKRTRRGSIQEIQAGSPPVKERPLTARQRSSQEKAKQKLLQAANGQEQTSSSGKDEQQRSDSPQENDGESKSATPLTARQRSLQACKDGETNCNLVEFPDGLNNLDRRRKARLTEEEKVAKKAEAATKRKQHVEKAAKEMQAQTIQKVLNQDSNRKKREEKLQRQKQEIAEVKKAAEIEVATNCIRWILGPVGTTVSWSQDVEFPLRFSEKQPCTYPPPREKCAACDNAYKYRDSKSNLPLCSLQCYKAVREGAVPVCEFSELYSIRSI